MLIKDMIKNLENSLDKCMDDFELTGALPSSIMEKPYSMLLSFYRSEKENNKNEQKYMSFMAENYFKPKYANLDR